MYLTSTLCLNSFKSDQAKIADINFSVVRFRRYTHGVHKGKETHLNVT